MTTFPASQDHRPSARLQIPAYAAFGFVAALFCSLMAGCGETVDANVLAARSKLILTDPPAGEQSLGEIRKKLSENDEADTVDVVVRGRIYAGAAPPWEEGKAIFILTDATGHDGDDDHDPHTCPFCSRHINDYLAEVSFFEDGKAIKIDSRELFDVEEKQLILIRGEARIDDDGLLRITANGIYIVK